MDMYFLSQKAKQKRLKKLWCVRKKNVISDSSNIEKPGQLKDARIAQSRNN